MELIKQAILPLLTLLIAVISLFVKPDQVKQPLDFFKRPRLVALMLLLLVSTSITVYFSYIGSSEKQVEIQKNEQTIAGLIDLLKEFRKETNASFQSLSSQLTSFGWQDPESANIEDIEESMKANEYRNILSKLDSTVQKDITVQYFPKNVDGDKVVNAMEELGYTVNIGNTQVNYVETNAIWFGTSVTTEDAKLIALTLIRAGVKVKVIRPFRNSAGRERLIQIGADAVYKNEPALTVNEIVTTKQFVRND